MGFGWNMHVYMDFDKLSIGIITFAYDAMCNSVIDNYLLYLQR